MRGRLTRMQLVRLYHTLRFLRLRQLFYQGFYRLRRRIRPKTRCLPLAVPTGGPWLVPPPYEDVLVDDTRLRIFGQDIEVRTPSDWNNERWEPLVLYNVHYFHALQGEASQSNQELSNCWIQRWISQNPPGHEPGWEPYPTSLRIVNWIKWSLRDHPLEPNAVQSLCHQTDVLSRSVEWQLMGNHLLANAKALVFAGLFFQGKEADRWRKQGLSILRRELAEQILEDGGHFERSPMYHSLILEDLLDLHNVMSKYGVEAEFRWKQVVKKMLAWLITLCHPDGGISLLNDSAMNVALKPKQLLDYASQLGYELPQAASEGVTFLAATGYIRHEQESVTVIVDVAPIGPDYIPGHAHADSLTFEMSMGGQRVIVDTGTSAYTPSDIRTTERATSAHNTIDIDGADSSEVWSTFRVARRARVKVRECQVDQVVAQHDGYCRLPGVGNHVRKWMWADNRLIVTDRIEGTGSHTLRWHLHFHPECHVEELRGNEFQVNLPNGSQLVIGLDEHLSVNVEDSWYAPEFGVRQDNQRLVGTYWGELPVSLTAIFSW